MIQYSVGCDLNIAYFCCLPWMPWPSQKKAGVGFDCGLCMCLNAACSSLACCKITVGQCSSENLLAHKPDIILATQASKACTSDHPDPDVHLLQDCLTTTYATPSLLVTADFTDTLI